MRETRSKSEVHSNRIRVILREKNMTQKSLADIALQGNKSHLCRIINGSNRCLSLAIAYKISKALDKSIEEVFIFKNT